MYCPSGWLAPHPAEKDKDPVLLPPLTEAVRLQPEVALGETVGLTLTPNELLQSKPPTN